jgi:hypothetical protein
MASDSIKDLFKDKGDLLGTGVVRGGEPEAAGDVGSLHHVESLTYVDKAGHIHAVLLDTVTTASGSRLSSTIEILSDVVITPPPG